MIEFSRYKNSLVDYMRLRGYDFDIGRMYSCPFHDDSTPSFTMTQNADGQTFYCFGCGAKGDVFDAAGLFIHSDDKKAQFAEIEAVFGGNVPSFVPPVKKERVAFSPDCGALDKLTQWLSGIQGRELSVLGYFQRRAEYKSSGSICQYPLTEEQLKKLSSFFYWWPGAKEAEKALGKKILFRAGVAYLKNGGELTVEEYELPTSFPQCGKENVVYVDISTEDSYRFNAETNRYEKCADDPRKIAWYHSGVLAKSAEGFKLLYMNENTFESEKRNPRAGTSFFPIPSEIPEGKTIILVEGEIDAILCQVCGIDNMFSMGGLGNLSVPKIKKYILPKNIPEIILFADNDKTPKCQSQKAFGLMPYAQGDKVMETVPEKLLRAGFGGRIRVTALPSDSQFKDPDDAIRNGRLDLVRKAIDEAKDYVPFAKPEKKVSSVERKKTAERKNTATRLTDELLSQILTHKKLRKQNMSETDADIFVRAIANALPESITDSAWAMLEDWGADKETVERPGSMPPDQILSVMRSYRAPRALIDKVCAALNFEPPAKKERESVFPIDFNEIKKLQAWKEYLYSGQSQYAASLCCHIFGGKLVYDNGKSQFFRYDAPVWTDEPNVDKLVTDTLTTIIDHFYKKEKESVRIVLERYRKEAADKTFQRKVTDSIKKDTEHDIWKRTVEFDNPNLTSETLTLLDSVLDFSGTEPYFRDAEPSEYRMQRMPFTRLQLEKSEEPKKYIEFIRGNFTDPATLEMFERFISLIPARTAQYKIAAFLNGGSNTGKSTTMRLLKSIYTYWQEYPVGEPESLIKSIPSDIVLKERNQTKSDDGRSPTLASIVNAGGAFCDETDNMQKIDAKLFKRFTGGSTISFRDNYESMKEHQITAQLILGTNELPDIITPGDSKLDEAILSRIMVVPFLVKHERVVSGDITADIKPEYPAIIMRYARIYCVVRHKLRGNIPQSALALEWKGKYIERNKNDIQRFVEERLEQAQNKAESWGSLYSAFCDHMEYKLDEFGIPEERNALTQRRFAAKMRAYFSLEGANADVVYIGGRSMRGLKGYRLKNPSEVSGSPPPVMQGVQVAPPPDDNPFGDGIF